MKNINERLQELNNKIITKDIFENNGFSNELKFKIFDYDAEDEYIVRDYIKFLQEKYEADMIIIDLYDILIDVLKELGYLELCFNIEKEKGTNYINELIIDTLGIATDVDMIIEKIKEYIEPNKLLIFTGLGKTYSIIRAHTVISELQNSINQNPVLIMFPGKYEDLKFKLFNIIDDDNYYNASAIVSRK